MGHRIRDALQHEKGVEKSICRQHCDGRVRSGSDGIDMGAVGCR